MKQLSREQIVTILLSILTTILTVFAIDFLKNKTDNNADVIDQ